MPGLPSDLQTVLTELERTAAAAERLSNGTSDPQFAWQPKNGQGWSIAQCVDHLALVANLYLAAMRPAIDDARAKGSSRKGPLAPGPIGAWFVRSQDAPPKRRFKAPSKIGPRPVLHRDEVMGRYRDVHRELRRMIEDSAAIDANATTFANPFIKAIRMKVATGLLVLAAHERRHIWQAEQVTRADGYPAS